MMEFAKGMRSSGWVFGAPAPRSLTHKEGCSLVLFTPSLSTTACSWPVNTMHPHDIMHSLALPLCSYWCSCQNYGSWTSWPACREMWVAASWFEAMSGDRLTVIQIIIHDFNIVHPDIQSYHWMVNWPNPRPTMPLIPRASLLLRRSSLGRFHLNHRTEAENTHCLKIRRSHRK